MKTKGYFTKTEIILWFISVAIILIPFIIVDRENYLTLLSSLLGVTALIFNAKGNPFGQFLVILFSLFYGLISYSFKYYGEMITYLGMTMPMAIIALITWLKNPYKGKKSEVRVNSISKAEIALMWLVTIIITIIFYFILRKFNTPNIIPSTISITTSFVAMYLTFRRSPYFAIAYSLNDIVLIVLWCMASIEDTQYISVVSCFIAFYINDIYGYINWRKIEKRQSAS